MALIDEFKVVVAGPNADGAADFLDPGSPAEMKIPDTIELAWFWNVDGGLSLFDNVGKTPTEIRVAGPNGSTFGIVRHPARSAGKLDVSDLLHESTEVDRQDAAMHRTDTIDYEFIVSGRVDIVLPGNKRRTLGPGDLLVMAGVPHAWENHYDEDCTYIAVTVGPASMPKR
jgi:mannose-6-phosphate isomerase-like protein (cupin superfamily)